MYLAYCVHIKGIILFLNNSENNCISRVMTPNFLLSFEVQVLFEALLHQMPNPSKWEYLLEWYLWPVQRKSTSHPAGDLQEQYKANNQRCYWNNSINSSQATVTGYWQKYRASSPSWSRKELCMLQIRISSVTLCKVES